MFGDPLGLVQQLLKQLEINLVCQFEHEVVCFVVVFAVERSDILLLTISLMLHLTDGFFSLAGENVKFVS